MPSDDSMAADTPESLTQRSTSSTGGPDDDTSNTANVQVSFYASQASLFPAHGCRQAWRLQIRAGYPAFVNICVPLIARGECEACMPSECELVSR
jgi:hypothetical protein